MGEKTKATAHVKVLLEIVLPDIWGVDCTLGQVYKQAEDSAINIISQQIAASTKNMQITGKPVVTAILVKKQ